MELSGKTKQFLAEAVRYRLTWYDGELARADLSDDKRSELATDKQFLASLLESLTQGRRSTEPGHG